MRNILSMHLPMLFKPVTHWIEENRFAFYKTIIISAVLFLAAFLIPRIFIGGHTKPLLLVMLCFVAAGAIILLRWPVLGLIGTIIGGMFVPFAGPSGLNAAVLGIAAMLGVWIMKMIVEQRKISIYASRTFIPLAVFIIFSLLSFGIGQLPWFTYAEHAPLNAQSGGLAIVIFSLGAFLLTAHLMDDLRWLQALTWVFILFGMVYVLGRFFEWGGIDRVYQSGFTAGSLFWTWLVALTFGQFFLNKGLRLRWRLVLGFCVLLTFYVAIKQAYDWKSGWLPPLVAVATIVAIRYWRRLLPLAPIGVLLAYYVATQSIGTDEYSWGTRLDAWLIVTEIVKASPLFGLGFANYYWYTPIFRIRGYAVRFNSHSQYVDLMAETGIVGLIVFFWFFWEVAKLGWSLKDRVPEGFAQAYVYGALGGLAGTVFAGFLVDWVLPFVYNIGLTGFRASVLAWLFLGGLVSLEHMYLGKAQS
jgi:O-antigen ligase